jgi:hypothetical protein
MERTLRIRAILITFLILFTASISTLSCSKKKIKKVQPILNGTKDLFIVIDTSKSMKGVGPTAKRLGMGDISSKVKESSTKFITDLIPGDTVTIVTFDSEPVFHGTFKIKTLSDKSFVKSKIMDISFEGEDTYTSRMITAVVDRVKEFETSDIKKIRRRVVVILSDGLDDPPVKKRKDKLKLTKDPRIKREDTAPLFIYYLHLSPTKVTTQQRRRIEELSGGRDGAVSVRQADPSRGREGVIERAVESTRRESGENIRRYEEKKKSPLVFFLKANWWWLLIALLALSAIIVFLIPLIKGSVKKNKKSMVGYLVYTDKKSNIKEETVVNLSKFNKGYVKIGGSKDDDVKLRGVFGFPGIRISGNKKGGREGFDITEDDLKKVNIIEQKKEGCISYDDVFEIENYSFTIKQNVAETR